SRSAPGCSPPYSDADTVLTGG
ncbi:MAG: hypothetical protein QOC82_3714, partial [Frankiaceae bacterium]|nr:hypothetical protein [Frankiaceae bacterium]